MTKNEQIDRLIGFHVSMLYIHHRLVITYLEGKESNLLNGYAKADFRGAQHHARELLNALNSKIAEGTEMKDVLGETATETTHFMVFAAQVAQIASGPATLETAEVLLQKSLLAGLGKLAAHVGLEGFAMFGDDSSSWLRGSLETMLLISGV